MSHRIPSSGQRLLDIFFSLPHISTTFFNLGLGGARGTEPVPEASHALLPLGREGEPSIPAFPLQDSQPFPIRKA